MKKLFIILSIIIFTSCHGVFNGVIVGKEYTPAYIGTSEPETRQEAMIGAGAAAAAAANNNRMAHEFHPAVFMLYVANQYKIRNIKVDSLEYVRVKVCQRYSYKY